MSFYKTSKADILAFRNTSEAGFTRNASQIKTSSFFQNNGTKVDVKAAIENVADTYKISKNPNDYIFVISRALTADVPNENNDAFPADELLRFDPKYGCRVFQTFNLKPNHINHRADDPTQARGVILDAHYNDMDSDNKFVEILVAVDKTKDRKIAEGILKGDINSMSMGCFSEECHCSICGHIASSSDELCPDHIRGGLKGKLFEGKKAYEKCYKVCFQEESWVDDPADPQALVSEVLGINAKLKEAEKKHKMEDESSILILSNRLSKIEESLGAMNKKANEERLIHDVNGPNWHVFTKIRLENNGVTILKNYSVNASDRALTEEEYNAIPNTELRPWNETGELDAKGNRLSTEYFVPTKGWLKINNPEWVYASDTPDLKKQAFKVETKFKQKKVEDSAITNIEQESETEVETNLDKFIEKSNTEELKPMSANEFGAVSATKNPYVKIAEGKVPSAWKSPGKSTGKVPSLWSNPGKGSGKVPSLWKAAFIEKLALDSKAEEYWKKYWGSYGEELVKDIKKKKLAGKLTVEQMKAIEPKFAGIMESAGIDTIAVDNVLELGDAINSVQAAKDQKSKLWSDIDNKIKTKKADLEIALCGDEWIFKEGSKNIFAIDNSFNITKEAFESDEFGQSICKSLLEDGAEKTAAEYRVSLYDATSNEPASILEGAEDDIRGEEKKKPTNGVEEGGSDDVADVYRGDIKEEGGVTEGATNDLKATKTADIKRFNEVMQIAEDLIEKDKLSAPKQDKLVDVIKELYLHPTEEKKEKEEDKIETEIEAPITDIMEPKESKKASTEDVRMIIKALTDQAIAEGKSTSSPEMLDAISAIKIAFDLAETHPISETLSSGETVTSNIYAKMVAEKVANILDSPITDLADKKDEAKDGVVENGIDDIKGVDRESNADHIYGGGQDDIAEDKGEVIKVGSKEYEEVISKTATEIAETRIAQEMDLFKKSYEARLKRALNISIRRANLNLIDNELKAAMYDVLTSEFELPTGEVVPALEGVDANCLIEAAFNKGAKKFFSNILAESDRAMNLSEDALIEVENDLNGLNVAPVTASYAKKEVVVNTKAKEAVEGNPIFKSSSEVAKSKFPSIKGIFRS